MAKTKISEFNANPALNTDIDSINLAEGCAPSGINDAIRELMSQLKDFQTGAVGDSFNGPVGSTTASTGAFTNVTATGNVGIGTSSPSAKLHVVGNTRITADIESTSNSVIYSSNGSAAGTINSGFNLVGSDSSVRFYTGNSERMRLDSSGNLGLGVTPSAWSAFKAFEIASVGNSLWSAGSNDLRFATNHVYNGGNKYAVNGYAAQYIQTAGQHQFYTAASGTAGNAITFTQAMTLDASGNLNIGTTSGSSDTPLNIYASVNASRYISLINNGSGTATTASMQVGANTGGDGRLTAYAQTHATLANHVSVFNHNGAGSLLLGTTGSEKARIDSSGNFCIGTTAAGTTAAGSYFEPSSIGYGRINFVKANTGTTYPVAFYYAGSQIGNIANSTTATSYNTSSDYRLKNVIGAVTGHGERIDALEPIEYEWKVDGSRTRGFLAHKFQEVYAGSVTGTKDAVDEQGNPVYQAMQASTSEVIADLVAEIQSLRKRLADAGL